MAINSIATEIKYKLNSLNLSNLRKAGVTTFYNKDKLSTTITHGEILRLSEAFAYELDVIHNINMNDNVLISFKNSVEFFVSFLALNILGATAVPINPDEKDYFKNYVSNTVNAKFLITDDKIKGEDCLSHIKVINLNISNISRFKNRKTQYYSPHYSDNAIIFFTSGTTSLAKGVCLGNQQIINNVNETIKALNLSENDHMSCILPIFHVNAFNFSFITPLLLNCDLTVFSNFHQFSFFDVIDKEKISMLSLSPSLVKLLNADPRDQKIKMKTVKLIITASAPLSVKDFQKFYTKFNILLTQGYGLSEAVNFSLLCDPAYSFEDYQNLIDKTKSVPTGLSHGLNTVQIIDEINKTVIDKEGIVGEIKVFGKNIMNGYFESKKVPKGVLSDGGLLTGDLGCFHYYKKKKVFYVVGRKKELINRSGKKVSPFELETILQQDDMFKNSVIVGFSNKWAGEEIGLLLFNFKDKEQNKNVYYKKLEHWFPSFKRPKIIVFSKDDVPRTSTGKIRRKLLSSHFKEYYEDLF